MRKWGVYVLLMAIMAGIGDAAAQSRERYRGEFEPVCFAGGLPAYAGRKAMYKGEYELASDTNKGDTVLGIISLSIDSFTVTYRLRKNGVHFSASGIWQFTGKSGNIQPVALQCSDGTVIAGVLTQYSTGNAHPKRALELDNGRLHFYMPLKEGIPEDKRLKR